ncbi:MAG: alpha/beta fold hydrolase [Gammaproteobacteria bacterium]|nr:alpha/beta fold hydrolase [Gammaproteobacteria bacterium]MBT6553568.1 alpha/beta fold hydrolase [Gammaproteobacteria bacterium]MBT6703706.1 alpha/beta fold hydrolase [Gammaproteobacteria bacterium]
MANNSNEFDDYDITNTYDLCIRAFRTTRKLLKLNIKLHDESRLPCRQTIEQGDIFLFNHFARFETFIPQYLIYTETGSYCRSIASAEFFNDERFAPFLRSIGVVPNTMPDLFPFIAKEILHGRKLVIFPEGGMVKDKRVVDDKGKYGVYSRTAMEVRKHHRGAAVIALAVDAFKTALLRDFSTGNYKQVERWAEQLDFADTESLMIKALKPTTIVPSHITFYPIRVNDNILHQAAKLFNKGINKRFAEELIIEGNLLFKHTDMDIRFSSPLIMGKYWKWWEKMLLPNVVHRFQSIEELFNLTPASGHWGGRIHSLGMQAKSNLVRDDYMQAMYKSVTINLSHIASYIILKFYHQGIKHIDCDVFHKTLYLCIKAIQKETIYLHRSLKNPQEYGVVIEGGSSRLQQFVDTTQKMELISIIKQPGEADAYHFHDKLTDEFHFDEIRTENIISVYANELAPLISVTKLLDKTFKTTQSVDARQIANFRYDDQLLAFEWDKKQYDKPRYEEINKLQTFTRDANWFRFLAEKENAPAVVLIHGFMATPAEMLSLGEKFKQLEFNVIGVRLKGHGTSPWDLRDRDWKDWAASVKRGYDILKPFSSKIHIIGFSTGGLLALHQAIEYPDDKLASVTSITAPVEFMSKQMKFVPLLHQANKLVRWVSSEGLIPFRPNDSEHPEVNYAHIPIRALYQLQKLIEHLFANPAPIQCPVNLLQSDQDPVVVHESVNQLYQLIDSKHKHIEIIESQRHGILYEDIDNTQQKIIDAILKLENSFQTTQQTHA